MGCFSGWLQSDGGNTAPAAVAGSGSIGIRDIYSAILQLYWDRQI